MISYARCCSFTCLNIAACALSEQPIREFYHIITPNVWQGGYLLFLQTGLIMVQLRYNIGKNPLIRAHLKSQHMPLKY